ncbi:UDP-N-acetylglucosamine 4,6-dehydratase (inverting) [Neochlamydia sp. TUME1]|uniref:UDP-N-acetylglucosamine 4,6-dehydratase (inverting) n=1 Tax=Neochlamydia sp. TUME1 TaxID=1478174 RepID=UPI00057EAD25|nr:UDP-N-acetylglucosamine 4,6-dehydratase (inverting) [Neochlamydia sp. TUME1]KIC72714.1 UDP-N-acetylglucosamine 4,6-dehydratase (inverting) [Neochlamydia sp. TUME1]
MHTTNFFKDKTLLITGGTGSFGQTLAKRLLIEDQCRKVIIFSRDEWKQWEMRQSAPIFSHPKIRYFLGDVRDKSRLKRAFSEVNYIVHAAALKQVPAAEYNPTEFIKTNIIGAMNVIDAAIDSGVEKVMALSTDKAANPINLYGATKLCADKLFVAGNSYVGARSHPTFAVVRYGNVLGSRGSVIPFWKKLLAEGAQALPITDKRMTRFWITLEQSVDFVLQSFLRSQGGEIFVPKIPSMKIVDLAQAFAPAIPHKYTGIREGEKLHELMIGLEDARHTLEFTDHYLIIPELYHHDESLKEKLLTRGEGRRLPEDFSYASNTNSQWLGIEALRQLILQL